MSQEIDNLNAAVATLTTTAAAAIANEHALKQKLDAALGQVTTLTAELATAQANSADVPAIVAATTAIAAQSQLIADATATTAPAN